MYGQSDYRMEAILGATNEATGAIDEFEADIDRAEARVEAFDGGEAAYQLTLDDEMFNADLDAAEGRVQEMDGTLIGIQMQLDSLGFKAEAATVQKIIDGLDGQTAVTEVEMRGVAGAIAQTTTLGMLMNQLQKQKVTELIDERAASVIPVVAGDFLTLISRSEALQAALRAVALTGIQDALAALPALAFAGAQGVGALATGIGEGLVGALGLGATSFALFGGSIAAAAIPMTSIVKDSMEMAKAIEEAETAVASAEKGTEEYQTALAELEALQGQANPRMLEFADSVTELGEKWNSMTQIVGEESLPALTRWVEFMEARIPGVGAMMSDAVRGFSVESEQFIEALGEDTRQLRRLEETLATVGDVSEDTFGIIFDGALLVGNVFFPLVDDAEDFLGVLEDLISTAAEWSDTAEGQKEIGEAWDFLLARARALYRTARDLGIGLYAVAVALEETGNVDVAVEGMEELAARFRDVTREGSRGRRELEDFMEDMEPILGAVVRLAGRAARQIALLAENVAEMKIEGTDVTLLEDILDSLGDALPNIRRALQRTFRETGPEIAELIDNFAELAEVASENSDIWGDLLGQVNRALRAFNNLDDDTQSLILNLLVANRVVSALSGGSGGGGGAGGLIGLAANAGITWYQFRKLKEIVQPVSGDLDDLAKKSDNVNRKMGPASTTTGTWAGRLGGLMRAAGLAGIALVGMELGSMAAGAGFEWAMNKNKAFEEQINSANPSLNEHKETVKIMGEEYAVTEEKFASWDNVLPGLIDRVRELGQANRDEATGSVLSWQMASDELVGNSIIPDMVNAMGHWLVEVLGGYIETAGDVWNSFIDAAQDAYNAVVGNSIVPDMVRDVDAEMGKLGPIADKRGGEFLEGLSRRFEEAKRSGEGLRELADGIAGGPRRSGGKDIGQQFEDMAEKVVRATRRMRTDGGKDIESLARDAERSTEKLERDSTGHLKRLAEEGTRSTRDLQVRGTHEFDAFNKSGTARTRDLEQNASRALDSLRKNGIDHTTDLQNTGSDQLETMNRNGSASTQQLRERGNTEMEDLKQRSSEYIKNLNADVSANMDEMRQKGEEATNQFKEKGSAHMEAAGTGMSQPIGVSKDTTGGYLEEMKAAMDKFIQETGIGDSGGGSGKGAPAGGTDASSGSMSPSNRPNAGSPTRDNHNRAYGGIDVGGGISDPRNPKQITWGEGDYPETAVFITTDPNPNVRRDNEEYTRHAAESIGGVFLSQAELAMASFARGGIAGRLNDEMRFARDVAFAEADDGTPVPIPFNRRGHGRTRPGSLEAEKFGSEWATLDGTSGSGAGPGNNGWDIGGSGPIGYTAAPEVADVAASGAAAWPDGWVVAGGDVNITVADLNGLVGLSYSSGKTLYDPAIQTTGSTHEFGHDLNLMHGGTGIMGGGGAINDADLQAVMEYRGLTMDAAGGGSGGSGGSGITINQSGTGPQRQIVRQFGNAARGGIFRFDLPGISQRDLDEAMRDARLPYVPPSVLTQLSPAHEVGGGEGFGTTMHTYIPEMEKYKNDVMQEFPEIYTNTYGTHPPGFPQPYYRERSIDHWGGGGRGAPIGSGTGDAVTNYAIGRLGGDLNWLIWAGRMLSASGWGPDTSGFSHYDHVHVTAFADGANAAGARGVGPDYRAMLESQIPMPPQFPDDIIGDSQSSTMGDYRQRLIAKLAGQAGGMAGAFSGGGDPSKNRQLGQQMNDAAGWAQYWSALDQLWQHESAWNHLAKNPTSSAYGIPQMLTDVHNLPSGYGPPGGDPAVQIEAGLGYIRDRYGNPGGAWDFWQNNGYYTNGGIALKDQWARVGDNGPEFFMPLGDPQAARGFVDFLAQLHPRGFDDEGAMQTYVDRALRTEKIDQRSAFAPDRRDRIEEAVQRSEHRTERAVRSVAQIFAEKMDEQNTILREEVPQTMGREFAGAHDYREQMDPKTLQAGEIGRERLARTKRSLGPVLSPYARRDERWDG